MYLEASMMDYSNGELWVRGMPSNMIASVTAKFLKAGINGRVQLLLNNWKKMYNDPQTPLMNVKRAVSNVAVQLREYLQKVAAHEDPSDNKNTALRILSSMMEAQRTNDPKKIVIS